MPSNQALRAQWLSQRQDKATQGQSEDGGTERADDLVPPPTVEAGSPATE